MDLEGAGKKRKLQLQELEEIRLESYANAEIYNQRTKVWHDKHILQKEFSIGEKVLLFQSKVKLFPGKLRSRWTGPHEVVRVYLHGAVEVRDLTTRGIFKVNGYRLKRYLGNVFEKDEEEIELEDPPPLEET